MDDETIPARIFQRSNIAGEYDEDAQEELVELVKQLESGEYVGEADTHGITIGKFEGRTCLYLNRNAPDWLRTAMNSWEKEAQKFHNDEITKEEYDHWRYHFPESAEEVRDTREPQVLNDRLIDKLRLKGFLEDESTGLDLEAIMRHREERRARKKRDDAET